jgi:uncharacterized membrane protein (DUF4010 family)
MSSGFIEILLSVGVALATGFLVGAERERSDRRSFAGARTFPLFGLAGALGAILGTYVLVALALALGALVAVAYYINSRSSDDIGSSTEVAALVTFCIGALCSSTELGLALGERLLLAAAIATATLTLLSLKKLLHRFVTSVSEDEVYATAKLLVLSVIVLPILPNDNLGPWNSLNPRAIGVLVVLVATIGFTGYVSVRVFGPDRGAGITGLLGGLASSLAVTLHFSGRSSRDPESVPTSAAAIVLASGVMFLRVVVETSLVAPAISVYLIVPLLGAAATALLGGTILYRRVPRDSHLSQGKTDPLNLQNPFSLSSALVFAAIFVSVMLASGAGAYYFKSAGVYVSAGVAGLASAHAASLSLAQMYSAHRVDQLVATNAIAVAVVVNTLFKLCLATVLGGTRLAKRVIPPLLLALCVGTSLHWIIVP